MRERLYRSRGDRMLFGVAGGMARYLDLDPSLVRIAWVLLVFAGGAGLLLYIIAAIVIPEEPLGAPAAPLASPSDAGAAPGSGSAWNYRAGVERRDRGGSAVLIGVVLVVVGAWLLLQRFVQIDSGLVWPVALLILGGALVLGAMRR
jgi:phage shock protein C